MTPLPLAPDARLANTPVEGVLRFHASDRGCGVVIAVARDGRGPRPDARASVGLPIHPAIAAKIMAVKPTLPAVRNEKRPHAYP